ncbi:MAG: HD domain-containing protein, partial [Clostridiales bacterium]|nr:HD domain-containing protein [Clostridiales bacterium]
KQTNDFVLSEGKPLDPMSKAAYEDILAHHPAKE